MADGTSEHSTEFDIHAESIQSSSFYICDPSEHTSEFEVKHAQHHHTSFDVMDPTLPEVEGRFGKITLVQWETIKFASAASARKWFIIHLDAAKDVYISTDEGLNSLNYELIGFKLVESNYTPKIESTQAWYAISIEADAYMWVYQNFRGG